MTCLQLTFPHLLSVLSVVLAVCMLHVDANQTKLEVKIYYEALCPDSFAFIRSRLQPSMSLNGRLNYTDLKFVPYGKVVFYTDQITKEKVLLCQHGKMECKLNALHACIIENNSNREAYEMISCLMRGYNTNLDECARRFNVDTTAAVRCTETRSIVDVLEKYGKETYAVDLSFVPTIAIDGVYDWDEQRDILTNFDHVFCQKYKKKFNIVLDGCNV